MRKRIKSVKVDIESNIPKKRSKKGTILFELYGHLTTKDMSDKLKWSIIMEAYKKAKHERLWEELKETVKQQEKSRI